MKNLIKSISLLAVAAMGLSACNEQNLTPEQVVKGELVTVHFGANSSIEPATKATLTTQDEKTFKSAWEDGDVLSVEYSNDGATNATGKVEAKWVDTTSSFDTTLPEYTGTWTYDAVYPAPNAKGEVDFGSARVQNGNAYNSKYDLMFGEAVAENAPAGKTDDGKDVIFNMDRQTGIVYFHLTSALDEEVVSATLSVSEVSDAIASSLVMPLEYAKGFDFDTKTAGLRDITITFEEGTSPKAKDFKLWFNVLPAEYDEMTLHVETTGHTLDMKRTVNTSDHFVAGKLYKTVATVPYAKWVAKSTPVTSEFKLFTGAIEEGDYVLYADNAMKASIASDRLQYSTVTNENGVISNPNDSIIWHIAPSGEYWTIYNEKVGSYAAGNGKNKAKLSSVASSDYELWSITKDNEGNFVIKNKGNASKEVNATLRQNGTYGFACYSASTGTAPVLYKSLAEGEKKYNATISTIENGTIIASPARAAEGTEVTLTATPDAGYVFNNDLTVKGADGTEISVVDGKFTMPAQDVTVSGTFSQKVYTITKATAENGSFTVKKGETEVTEANYKDVITLEATPAEGYICDSWSVKDADGESINVNSNKFTMPASNVTISVIFVEKPVDVKYDHAGTEADPYNISDVFKLLSTLGTETSSEIYAKGTITSIKEVSTKYKNATYYIGDDSTTETIQVYRGKYLNGANFTSTDQIQVGDEVVIKGKVKVFVKDNIETKEFDAGSSIISLRRIEPCATPVITIDESGAATITCETIGATVHYTVGESPADPTESDAVYSSAVTLTDGQTIKAIATAEGYKPSAIASKKYTVGGVTITKEIKDISGTTEDGTKVSSMTMDDVITLSASTSGNNGKVYESGKEWRLYYSDEGTMTVSSKAGYVIESITVTFTVKSKGTLKYGESSLTTDTPIVVSGSNVVFTVGAGQVKVTKVSVTYKQQ